MKKKLTALILALLALVFSGIYQYITKVDSPVREYLEKESIALFNNEAYTKINNNKPYFTDDDYTTTAFEEYGNLDHLQRCTLAYACLGKETMPTKDRESIGQIKPSGWQISKYDFIDGKYLYNRCHLIGFQLSGENANEKNLITGTRYLNTEGMLPFENMVAEYIKESGNHVLYRVTPVFEGNNLVASAVVMEAYSVEDNGKGICFNVYVYNIQPGVSIDYATGNNRLSADIKAQAGSKDSYILNTNSKKIHTDTCSGAMDINPKNKEVYHGSLKNLLATGYDTCSMCNPK